MPWVSYAQNAEDVMLMRALREVTHGFYVDVGANDPRADSVTRAFYERGWRGINLEPVPFWHDLLVRDRPRDLNLPIAAASRPGTIDLWEIVGTGLSTADPGTAQRHRAEGREPRPLEVPARPLDEILADAGADEIHFLKVDVEGFETEVLRGLDLGRTRPWIVLVEATEPGGQREVHGAWEPLLTGNGYAMVWFDGLNRFYLADEHRRLRPAFAAPPNVFDDFIRYSEWLARHDVATLRAELDAERLDGARLRARVRTLQARLAALYASRSWKLAAPARALVDTARRLLGRPVAAPWADEIPDDAPLAVPTTAVATMVAEESALSPRHPPGPGPGKGDESPGLQAARPCAPQPDTAHALGARARARLAELRAAARSAGGIS